MRNLSSSEPEPARAADREEGGVVRADGTVDGEVEAVDGGCKFRILPMADAKLICHMLRVALRTATTRKTKMAYALSSLNQSRACDIQHKRTRILSCKTTDVCHYLKM